jgi:hypothetical protein
MMRWSGRIGGCSTLVITLLVFAWTFPAKAANIRWSPSIALEGAWDSNIFNTNTDETSDYVFRARPRLGVYWNDYQTTIRIDGGIQAEWYSDNSELDNWADTKDVTFSVTDPMQITPRFSLRPFFRFVESKDPAQRNALTQAPAPGVPPSEAIVATRQTQRTYQGLLRMGYQLTPRTDLSLGGGILASDYSGDPAITGDQNYMTVTSDVSFLYKLTPRLSSGLFYLFGYNSFEQDPDFNTHTGGLEGRYRLTELYTLTVRGGATYLDYPSVSNSAEWFPFGTFDVTYRRQYLLVSLVSSYYLVGGSSGLPTKRGNVGLVMSNRITEKWSWNLSGYYQTNVTNDDPPTRDVNTFQGAGGVEYLVVDWASVNFAGAIVRQSSSGVQVDDVDRESVFLGIKVSPPYKPF